MTTDERFESVEKRLEIVFSPTAGKLREKLTEKVLEKILTPVKCHIVSRKLEEKVHAYLAWLESLMGITDHRNVVSVLYTRGSFFWSERHPFPHNDDTKENKESVKLLEKFTKLKPMKALCMGTRNRKWHLLGGFSRDSLNSQGDFVTVEMSMRGLDREKAKVFYEKEIVNKTTMTEESGICYIFPNALIDAHAFNKCGYSMNGIEGSFASFKSFGYDFKNEKKFKHVIPTVLKCFNPKQFTMTVYLTVPLKGNEPELKVDLKGYKCLEKKIHKLDNGGSIVYQSFEA
ncbi:hypothetical protein Bca4012_068209 [Brassica carinata]